MTNIWYHHGALIWRNKPNNSNSCSSLNLDSPPWAGVLDAWFPAGGFRFGDRGGFESYCQILAPVSLPCCKQPRLYCLACGPFPLKAQTKIKVPSLRLFLSGDPNHNNVRVTNASLTWVNTFSVPWFLCLMIPGRMLRYSYLFPGPKHPAGPASFLDLTLNGLNTRLSSTR